MKLSELKKAISYYDKTGCVRPWNKKNYVGVELECIFPAKKVGTLLLADALLKAGLDKKVRLGDDGSIKRKENECDLEVRIIDTERNINFTIEKVCKVLKEFKCYVNKSCGLHVHLDMRNKQDDELRRIFNNLYKSENFLFSLVSRNRHKNLFCKKLTKYVYFKSKMEPYFDGTGGWKYRVIPRKRVRMNFDNALKAENRRTGINVKSFSEHETFEIRMHEGTLDSYKINRWIKILLSVAKHDNIKKQVPVKSAGLKMLGVL